MCAAQFQEKLFRQIDSTESLDVFHQRCIVPSAQEIASLNYQVDEFVRFLEQKFSSQPVNTVARVIKSGSLGKGTAVRESADIDLVVFFNGLSSIQDLQRIRKSVFDLIEDYIKDYGPWQGRIEKKKRTRFSVSYFLDGHEVDILPAFDLTSYKSKAEVYHYLQVVAQQKSRGFVAQQLSASLAPFQVDFVKHVDESVKKVIRLLKKWKQERKVHELRSYTLEVLTIHTATSGRGNAGTAGLFRSVMSRLSDGTSLRVAFDVNYRSGDYTRHLEAPFILDPANPFNNLLHRVDMKKVSQEASLTLHHRIL